KLFNAKHLTPSVVYASGASSASTRATSSFHCSSLGKPGSPLSPLAPLAPGVPGSPLSPLAPFAPAAPGSPLSPFGPCGPASPFGPGSATTAWASAMPCSILFRFAALIAGLESLTQVVFVYAIQIPILRQSVIYRHRAECPPPAT